MSNEISAISQNTSNTSHVKQKKSVSFREKIDIRSFSVQQIYDDFVEITQDTHTYINSPYEQKKPLKIGKMIRKEIRILKEENSNIFQKNIPKNTDSLIRGIIQENIKNAQEKIEQENQLEEPMNEPMQKNRRRSTTFDMKDLEQSHKIEDMELLYQLQESLNSNNIKIQKS